MSACNLALFLFMWVSNCNSAMFLFMFLLAQCMLTYWEIRNRLAAVRCPSCRQKVMVSLSLLTSWSYL